MLKCNRLFLRALTVHPCICRCNYSTRVAAEQKNEGKSANSPQKASNSVDDKSYMPTSKVKLRNYLHSEPHLYEMSRYIPDKHLVLRQRNTIENLYLVDSHIAKDVVSQILPIITKNKNQIVCETNAGLGLISSELLDSGLPMVRLYEACPEFRIALKDFNSVYQGRIELFSKDLYHIHTMDYLDRIDNGRRIEQLLRDVPKKHWSDEPVMTIIGAMSKSYFLKFLIKSLALQSKIIRYGRFQIFAFMLPRDYITLTANADFNLHTYQSWSVLFNLLFDWKLLCKYTRKAFVPWDMKFTIYSQTRYVSKIDHDQMYFVQLEFKRQLPVETDKLLHLYYFIKQLFGRGGKPVIPTLEKWFPDSGLNLFLPQYEHHKNFPEDIDLFTIFGELHPQEILSIFNEFVNLPSYAYSPFVGMIESHLVKTETIESDLVTEGELEKDTIEELEEKFVT